MLRRKENKEKCYSTCRNILIASGGMTCFHWKNSSVRIEDERVLTLVETLKDLIAEEVRADVFDIGSGIEVSGALVKDWDVEGIAMKMGIEKKLLRN